MALRMFKIEIIFIMKIRFTYWLRRMDLFGVPITFIGAHRLYYQTKLGGICSVLMIAYLMYLVDLINLNVMTVITNTVFSYDPE